MSKAGQFREYADEAIQWSRESKAEEARNALIDLARTWTQAAAFSEGVVVSQSKGSEPKD
jgi:hypothetical protein